MDELIYLYILIFPFGKILGITPDLLIGLIALMNFRKTLLNNFLVVCIFSLFFSLSFFNFHQLFLGILYLMRFVSYFIFGQVVLEKFGKNKRKSKFIFNKLILVGVLIAVFGWIQYLFLPDLRFLKNLGWDDHYFRLIGTFIDPAFTGILLVLSEILVLIKTIEKKSHFNFLLNLIFIFTILFTYSRSSYLALVAAIGFLFIKFKEKFLLFFLILFLVLVPLLPRKSSEGTNLVRTYSIGQKFINYDDSLKIIQKSPIFGIGFDNICVAKNKFLNSDNWKSHTCSGLDNSILFIIATTGILGLIVFAQFIFQIIENTKFDFYGWGLMASLIAVFVHGMFTNTFFYNFVMGWMAMLIAVTRLRFKD